MLQGLLLVTVEVAEDILSQSQMHVLQHYFEPEAGPISNAFLSQAVQKLDTGLHKTQVLEARAEQKWKEHWKSKQGPQFFTPWI